MTARDHESGFPARRISPIKSFIRSITKLAQIQKVRRAKLRLRQPFSISSTNINHSTTCLSEVLPAVVAGSAVAAVVLAVDVEVSDECDERFSGGISQRQSHRNAETMNSLGRGGFSAPMGPPATVMGSLFLENLYDENQEELMSCRTRLFHARLRRRDGLLIQQRQDSVLQRPDLPREQGATNHSRTANLEPRTKLMDILHTIDSHRQGRRNPRSHQPGLLHHQASGRYCRDLLQVRR